MKKKKEEIKIAYLYSGKSLGKEEKLFIKLSKKKNIKLDMYNIIRKINEEEFIESMKNYDLVYVGTAEDYVQEYAKTAEECGKVVIDSPNSYYLAQDKWVFYVKCKEHNIPTPDTILLSRNIPIAKQELKEWGRWPVILKRIIGTMGEYVEKADNPEQAEKVINRFWEKGSEKLPIIAQEMVLSPSYRVTAINSKVVQTAIKKVGHGLKSWKATGVYGKTFESFEVDKNLQELVEKTARMSKIRLCGIDFLKKEGKWLVLEINSEPALDFIESEHEKMINLTLDMLKEIAEKEKQKNQTGEIK